MIRLWTLLVLAGCGPGIETAILVRLDGDPGAVRASADRLEVVVDPGTPFLDDAGELKPRFRPAPMVASFMAEPGKGQAGHIPVPKGPVEVW